MNRSELMSRIKTMHTLPEVAVRRFLHGAGFRFRLHQKALPGKPDIVLRKHGTVIFVNGCFWHGHSCKKGTTRPKSNAEFWRKKIDGNVRRDEMNKQKLQDMGWRVIEVWECQTKTQELLTERLSGLLLGKSVTA